MSARKKTNFKTCFNSIIQSSNLNKPKRIKMQAHKQ